MSMLAGFRRLVPPPSLNADTGNSGLSPQVSATPQHSSTSFGHAPLFDNLSDDNQEPTDLSLTTSGTPEAAATSRTRSRPDDFDAVPGRSTLGSIDGHTAKRLKTYAQGVATELELDTDTLVKFTQLPTHAHMLVDIKASIMNMYKVKARDKLSQYLDTEDFAKALRNRLTVALLSPNATAYLNGLIPQITALIKKDPEALSVPAGVIDYPDLFEKVTSMLSGFLATCRGQIKAKLVLSLGSVAVTNTSSKSVKSKSKIQRAKIINIAQLTASLVPSTLYVEVRTMHWCRIAFLRYALVKFSEILASQGSRNDMLNAPEGNAVVSQNTEHNNIFEHINTSTQASGGASADAFGSAATHTAGAGASSHASSSSANSDSIGTSQDRRAQSTAQQPVKPAAPEDEYDPTEFWIFVDNELAVLRNVIKEEHGTPEDREVAWSTFLTGLVAEDLKTYKAKNVACPSKPVNMAAPFPWQAVIENAMVW